jgi:CheY-like chemotaxis protein
MGRVYYHRSRSEEACWVKAVGTAITPLNGLRVLIVEDETLVAMLIEEYLLELGCEVAFSASRVGKAMRGLQSCGIDVAVLDVNVAGESISPLVETLVQRGIPFIFASGYGVRGVDPRWSRSPVLQKPFTGADLQAALIASLESAH